jgi:hypothetical protein
LKLPLQQGEAALPAEIKADEWDAVKKELDAS